MYHILPKKANATYKKSIYFKSYTKKELKTEFKFNLELFLNYATSKKKVITIEDVLDDKLELATSSISINVASLTSPPE